jgi:CheY-like chemotaxis protein
MDAKKVLIAEDHSDCRELLKIVLARSGYIVLQVATGLEALERASATNPDLIVMDFGLPDVSGDKVIDCLKSDPHTMKIPVIVTTGYMTIEVTKRALAAGATAVLLKPYHIDELLEAIQQCLTTGAESDSRPPGYVPPGQLPLV